MFRKGTMNSSSKPKDMAYNLTLPPYKYGSWVLSEVVTILSAVLFSYVLFRLVKDEMARGNISRHFEGRQFLNLIESHRFTYTL